jgi:integrase/recombinase XerD
MEEPIERMKMDLVLQDYSDKTIKSYLWHIADFSVYFQDRPLDTLGEEEIRRYLYHIKEEKKYGRAYLSQAYSAIKFFYRETLRMPLKLGDLRGPRRFLRLPVVFSREEVQRLFEATENQKYRLIFMITYSGGLRVNETAHLRVTDIDSKRMLIRINQGKGRKDRYTLLSAMVLEKLRSYWKTDRPQDWLFPKKRGDGPICTSNIQRMFKDSKKKQASQNPPRFTPFATVLQPIF